MNLINELVVEPLTFSILSKIEISIIKPVKEALILDTYFSLNNSEVELSEQLIAISNETMNWILKKEFKPEFLLKKYELPDASIGKLFCTLISSQKNDNYINFKNLNSQYNEFNIEKMGYYDNVFVADLLWVASIVIDMEKYYIFRINYEGEVPPRLIKPKEGMVFKELVKTKSKIIETYNIVTYIQKSKGLARDLKLTDPEMVVCEPIDKLTYEKLKKENNSKIVYRNSSNEFYVKTNSKSNYIFISENGSTTAAGMRLLIGLKEIKPSVMGARISKVGRLLFFEKKIDGVYESTHLLKKTELPIGKILNSGSLMGYQAILYDDMTIIVGKTYSTEPSLMLLERRFTSINYVDYVLDTSATEKVKALTYESPLLHSPSAFTINGKIYQKVTSFWNSEKTYYLFDPAKLDEEGDEIDVLDYLQFSPISAITAFLYDGKSYQIYDTSTISLTHTLVQIMISSIFDIKGEHASEEIGGNPRDLQIERNEEGNLVRYELEVKTSSSVSRAISNLEDKRYQGYYGVIGTPMGIMLDTKLLRDSLLIIDDNKIMKLKIASAIIKNYFNLRFERRDLTGFGIYSLRIPTAYDQSAISAKDLMINNVNGILPEKSLDRIEREFRLESELEPIVDVVKEKKFNNLKLEIEDY